MFAISSQTLQSNSKSCLCKHAENVMTSIQGKKKKKKAAFPIDGGTTIKAGVGVQTSGELSSVVKSDRRGEKIHYWASFIAFIVTAADGSAAAAAAAAGGGRQGRQRRLTQLGKVDRRISPPYPARPSPLHPAAPPPHLLRQTPTTDFKAIGPNKQQAGCG